MRVFTHYRREVEYCTYCPKMCRFACPAAFAWKTEAATPTAKMTILHLVDAGELDWTLDVAESAYRCFACLRSHTQCLHHIAVFPPFQEARRQAVLRGAAPAPVFELLRRFKEHGHPYDPAIEDSGAAFLREVGETTLEGEGVLFYPGTTALSVTPESLLPAWEILAAHASCVSPYPAPHRDSGYNAYVVGIEDHAERLARGTADTINARRPEAIVCLAPEDAYAMRVLYPKWRCAVKARVLHLSEWLAEQESPGAGKSGRILYQDSCMLGRYLGVYDAPRTVLTRAGYDIVEPPETREDAPCCGGGGGMPDIYPDKARMVAAERFRVARELGVDAIVGSSPACVRSLKAAAGDIPVMDLVEAVAG